MTCATCQPKAGWWHKVWQQCKTCGGWPLHEDERMNKARNGAEFYEAPKQEERRKVMEALDQLEEHSPTWIAMIRAYITRLEGRR